jgi:hypothetical protein
MPPTNSLDLLQEWTAKNRRLEDILKTSSQYSAMVESISEAHRRFTENLGPVEELQRRINESVSANSGAIAQLQKAVAEATSWASRLTSPIAEQMERFNRYTLQHQTDLQKLTAWADSFTRKTSLPKEIENLWSFGAQHQRLIEQTQAQIAEFLQKPSSLDSLRKVIEEAHWSGEYSLTVHETNSVVSEAREISDAAISKQLTELSASIAQTSTAAEFFSVLLRYARTYGIPAGIFLLVLFRDVLVNWTAAQLPSIDTVASSTGLSQRAAIKEAQQNARVSLTDEQRDALRFVSSPTLNVHVSPKMKSKSVARLPFGTLVTVSQRSGDWVYAVYRDPVSREESEGWLLARYVKRFDK